MSKKTGIISKKKLPNIIDLTLDHLKTSINYKAVPKNFRKKKPTTGKLDADGKM